MNKEYITIAYSNVLLPESLLTYKEEMRKSKYEMLYNKFLKLFVLVKPLY